MASSEALWTLPEPLATLDVALDGGSTVTLRRHGNPDGPRLVLSHGNGLAIDLYYPFWSLLAGEFDLIVHDLRNHGRNALGPIEHHNLPTLARDHDRVLEAIDAHYGAKPKAAVLHSLAGLAALLAPGNGGGLSALVLFDPPLRKPGIGHEEFDDAVLRLAEAARRRSGRFASRKAFADLLHFASNFRNVVPGVRELVPETTLRPAADGDGYELCCPPLYEARMIEYARVFAVYVDLLAFQCPLKIIGADPTLPYSYLPTFDLREMAGVDYDFIPDATHLLQLEQPEECVAATREFLALHGFLQAADAGECAR